jgi:hypothetical protein
MRFVDGLTCKFVIVRLSSLRVDRRRAPLLPLGMQRPRVGVATLSSAQSTADECPFAPAGARCASRDAIALAQGDRALPTIESFVVYKINSHR